MLNALTNERVIYSFKDLLDKQQLSDEIGYSNRWIYYHLLTYRATLLKQKKDKEKLSNYNYQTITLNLDEIENSEFGCNGETSCKLLRTKVPIPNFIHLESITSVINTTGETITYTEISPEVIKYKQFSRLPSTSYQTYYFLQNTGNGVYVYLWSNNIELSKAISIKMIAYEPHLLQAIKDCDGNLDDCFNYNLAEFIIDPELLSIVSKMAIDGLLRFKSPVSDLFPDGNDKEQSPK